MKVGLIRVHTFYSAGTDTSKCCGYKACRCLEKFYRTDRFGSCMLCGSVEGEENCPVEDMKCINDDAELGKGYWWE